VGRRKTGGAGRQSVLPAARLPVQPSVPPREVEATLQYVPTTELPLAGTRGELPVDRTKCRRTQPELAASVSTGVLREAATETTLISRRIEGVSKRNKQTSKMVGTVNFNLDPPDGRAAKARTDVPSVTPPDAEPEAMVGPAVPVPPRLPYAPGPGSYTQLWSSQSATRMAEEMKDEMEAYRKTYMGAAPDYPGIQTTIVNSSDWMGFLTVLSGNQVVLVHSLGLFSSGLGSPTPAHN
jgi:hypothetical protein